MNIVLVGAAGYGESYLRWMDRLGLFGRLCAVVDPGAQHSGYHQRLLQENIPIYDSLEAFYQKGTADLVVVCSPIGFHEQQVVFALSQGAHVLCEKPLTATLPQAERIRQARDAAGKQLGVGFQWSFCHPMRLLKEKILSGALGKPLALHTALAWPRPDAYYETSNWKGRLNDPSGRPVFDSVVSNATAHYLHNMLFLLGDTMQTACLPKEVEGSLYRGRAIETFDTCFLRGAFHGGATFSFAASHVAEEERDIYLSYRFEEGVVTLKEHPGRLTLTWEDGRVEELGDPMSLPEEARKLTDMIDCAEQGTAPVCGVETVLPHLTICSALFEKMPVWDIPQEMLRRMEAPDSVVVDGMCDALMRCAMSGKLPDELGYGWAAAPTAIRFP